MFVAATVFNGALDVSLTALPSCARKAPSDAFCSRGENFYISMNIFYRQPPPAEHSSPGRRLSRVVIPPPCREGPRNHPHEIGVSADARRPYARGRCGPDAHYSRGSKLGRAKRPPHRPRRGCYGDAVVRGLEIILTRSGGVGGGVCTIPAGALARRAAPGQIAGPFVAEERGCHELKGVPEPVTLFRLVPGKRRGRRTGQRHLTPLVGREEEIAMLMRR
jgi:hypothetical protein